MSSRQLKAPTDTLRVVVNDASCLIDLRKVELLLAMLRLPYRFTVALPIRENELLDFTADEWQRLESAGLEVVDLTGEQIGRAFEHRAAHAKLSAEDCFSLTLAEDPSGPVLLTGDASLRKVAERLSIEVHGVLWVLDELHRLALFEPAELCKCLEGWRDDPFVRLPAAALTTRLRHLRSL